MGKIRDEDLEPELGPFSWYVDCFREIETCRDGMSGGPIPFTAIVEYCKLYDIDEVEEFMYLIRQMDNTLLDLQSKKDSKDA